MRELYTWEQTKGQSQEQPQEQPREQPRYKSLEQPHKAGSMTALNRANNHRGDERCVTTVSVIASEKDFVMNFGKISMKKVVRS